MVSTPEPATHSPATPPDALSEFAASVASRSEHSPSLGDSTSLSVVTSIVAAPHAVEGTSSAPSTIAAQTTTLRLTAIEPTVSGLDQRVKDRSGGNARTWRGLKPGPPAQATSRRQRPPIAGRSRSRCHAMRGTISARHPQTGVFRRASRPRCERLGAARLAHEVPQPHVARLSNQSCAPSFGIA